MEDGHLASLGGLLHRGFGGLRLFILESHPHRVLPSGAGVTASVRESRYLRVSIFSHGEGGRGYWSGYGSGPAVSRTRGRSSPPAGASFRSYDRTGGLPPALPGPAVHGPAGSWTFSWISAGGAVPRFGFPSISGSTTGRRITCSEISRLTGRICGCARGFMALFMATFMADWTSGFLTGDIITGCRRDLTFRLCDNGNLFTDSMTCLTCARRGGGAAFLGKASSSGALVKEISRFTGGCFSRSLTGFFVGFSSWLLHGISGSAGCWFLLRFCRFVGDRALSPGRLIFLVEKGNPLIDLGRPVHPVLDKNNLHCLDLIIGRADGQGQEPDRNFQKTRLILPARVFRGTSLAVTLSFFSCVSMRKIRRSVI